jgi:4-hydroxy-3-polyprenylbenzoate decarboxylase
MGHFKDTVTLAITGASGVQYAMRLLQVLVAQDIRIFVMVSKAAQVVAAVETDVKLTGNSSALEIYLSSLNNAREGQIKVFGKEQWMAPVASGSGSPYAMVVCPCSTGCLSAIATGASNNLIERAADVVLKERKKLILVPREAPYSEIHLENMLKLTRMGAVILPASPGFYHQPKNIEDLIDFVVARILSQLGLTQDLLKTWGSEYLITKESEA